MSLYPELPPEYTPQPPPTFSAAPHTHAHTAVVAPTAPPPSDIDDAAVGGGSSSDDDFMPERYGLSSLATRANTSTSASLAAVRRAETEGKPRIGEIRKKDTTNASAQPPPTYGTRTAYDLTREIRVEGGVDTLAPPPPAPDPVPPGVGRRLAGYLYQGVTAVRAIDPKRTSVDVRLYAAGVRTASPMCTVISGLLDCKVPMADWHRYKIDLSSCDTWTALSDLAGVKSSAIFLDKLALCGWTLRTICTDPRYPTNQDGAWWNTCKAWGFTGAMVARGMHDPRAAPWLDIRTITCDMRVGLQKMHVEAALTIRDLLDGVIPSGFLSQLYTIDGWDSPLLYMREVMAMTASEFVNFRYKLEEWVYNLGLSKKVAKKLGLMKNENVFALLCAHRGWTQERYDCLVCGKIPPTEEEKARILQERQQEEMEKAMPPPPDYFSHDAQRTVTAEPPLPAIPAAIPQRTVAAPARKQGGGVPSKPTGPQKKPYDMQAHVHAFAQKHKDYM